MEPKVFTTGSDATIQYKTEGSDGKGGIHELTGDAVGFEADLLMFKVYRPKHRPVQGTELHFVEVRFNNVVTYTGQGVVGEESYDDKFYYYPIRLTVPWPSESPWDIDEVALDVEASFKQWNTRQEMLNDHYVRIVRELEFCLLQFKLYTEQKRVSRLAKGEDIETANAAIAEEVYPLFLDILYERFQRFESIARSLDYEAIARKFYSNIKGGELEKRVKEIERIHADHARRVLHPLLLGSPFIYRVFWKPLGHAGDFEMVNMILSEERLLGPDPLSMCLNRAFLESDVAQGHRNRIDMLVAEVKKKALKVLETEDEVRILDVGHGPAHWVLRLLADPELAGRVKFTLMDSSDKASAHVKNQVSGMNLDSEPEFLVKNAVWLALRAEVSRKREGLDAPAEDPQYHIVVCAGMFDYLDDEKASMVLALFNSWLYAGGLIIWTNVTPANPIRKTMEHDGDWNLIHREIMHMERLGSPFGELDHLLDRTTTNAFQFIRKPGG